MNKYDALAFMLQRTLVVAFFHQIFNQLLDCFLSGSTNGKKNSKERNTFIDFQSKYMNPRFRTCGHLLIVKNGSWWIKSEKCKNAAAPVRRVESLNEWLGSNLVKRFALCWASFVRCRSCALASMVISATFVTVPILILWRFSCYTNAFPWLMKDIVRRWFK